jgi:hypothetical protein
VKENEMAMTLYEQRARTGEVLLDRERPGWEWDEGFDEKNLPKLNIKSATCCMLGVLYASEEFFGNLYLGVSGFMIGCEKLGLKTSRQKLDHGFLGNDAQTEAWIKLIREKREKSFKTMEDWGTAEDESGVRTGELVTV